MALLPGTYVQLLRSKPLGLPPHMLTLLDLCRKVPEKGRGDPDNFKTPSPWQVLLKSSAPWS